MAHFMRSKATGIASDLSSGISSEFFQLDDLARYGINSQISALAYDPVQFLLAVGTNDTSFGPGQVYVFGQKRVQVVFNLQRRASVKEIQFCGDKLLVLSNRDEITVFGLESKRRVASYSPPGHVTALVSDPSLDYVLTGLQNGEVVAYDLDREAMTPFKIPNLWRERNPRARALPVVAMQFHPKDIGSLLIAYSEGAMIYSFKQNKALKFFRYEVPRGAPGGNGAAGDANSPSLTHALWHPTGTFILTVHDDSSLVFWDPRDGRIVEARTIEETAINMPSSGRAVGVSASIKEPYGKIAWCSKQNPDDTGILIAGGQPASSPMPGLTFIELGMTPNYQTSTWDFLTQHFRNPKRVHLLPTPPGAQVAGFTLVPRLSPHYAGSHDPIAVMAVLNSGELVTMSFPSGYPISPTNQLHVSLSNVHPYLTKFAMADVDRTRWLGMKESRDHGPNFLLGGAEASKPMKRHESRNIVQTAHSDGAIRLWDVGCGDEIENGSAMQVDVARAVGRYDVEITEISMSGTTGELAAGLRSGEVVVFRLGKNQQHGRSPATASKNEAAGELTDIMKRADPGLKDGLLPLTLSNEQQGSVTALKLSNVGFLAAGYESGSITLIDLRGPAIIHTARLADFSQPSHRGLAGAIKGRRASVGLSEEYPTILEFGIMTLDEDVYSSIALFVGTNSGRVYTFKILPSASGRFSADLAGVSQLDGSPVTSISPIDSTTGASAIATGKAMSSLQSGQRTTGTLVITTKTHAHVLRPTSSKPYSKSFDLPSSAICTTASVTRFETRGYALVAISTDGYARSYTLPSLHTIGSINLSRTIPTSQIHTARTNSAGDVLAQTGPAEFALLSVWGANQSLPASQDKLYDAAKLPIPRPTISSLQWIAGTQYITPADLDILIGGPGRPPSKRMLAEAAAARDSEFLRQRELARTGTDNSVGSSGSRSGTRNEGWGEWATRQIQERTENLGLASESMDRTAEASEGFSDSVSKFVARQKRQALLGFVGGKIGL